jgi:methionyl-tRNA formyltransferase
MTRFAFAGDREVAVRCLAFLVESDARPEALLVSSPDRATHSEELQAISGLGPDRVLTGKEFREPQGVDLLRSLHLDYVIGVHFPYIVPEAVLSLPRLGVVNLHPAYLPYNRGWHTPSWALLDGTPIGATLHFMDSGVDTGDIVAQTRLEVLPEDTAHTLYQRVLDLEVELFEEAWPLLTSGNPPRTPQAPDEGTRHDRADLGADTVRRIDLNGPALDALRTLRALTTNDLSEAAYFEVEGRRYLVQITISPDSLETRHGD